MMVEVTQEAERWYQSLPREQFDLFLQCVRDAEKRGARLALEAAANRADLIVATGRTEFALGYDAGAEMAASAIRALDPAKIVGKG